MVPCLDNKLLKTYNLETKELKEFELDFEVSGPSRYVYDKELIYVIAAGKGYNECYKVKLNGSSETLPNLNDWMW